MGLLRRKQAQPILLSRNPTGLPSAPKDEEPPIQTTSLLAAQAAAAHLAPKSQQTALKRPQSTRRGSKTAQPQQLLQSNSPIQRSASRKEAPGYSRATEPSLDHLSPHDDEHQHSLMSLAASSLAAHNAMIQSNDYLAPPHHRVYGSSPSTSAISSNNSLESPTFRPKLAADDDFSSLNHLSPSWSDGDAGNFSSDDLDPLGGVPRISGRLGAPFDSRVRSMDNIPTTIPEHESLHSKVTTRPRQIAFRKPPPGSPSQCSSPEQSSLLQVKRASSPRRKPPPDVDPLDDFSVTATDVDDEESLPQYPVGPDVDQRRRHSRHHGLRKGAKTILKMGNPLSYTPGSFLGETERRPSQLRTTLRKEKKKNVFNEDKPWKHHTDRTTITEQERKRYEGVWVSNKGLYMDLVDPQDVNRDLEVPGELNSAIKASMAPHGTESLDPLMANLMLNLVAREIWLRSKLPAESLRQVWDLVDTRHDGCLDRTSFIVGMWLVDQCLYGRKLPKVVSDDVWSSVSYAGVNVILKGKKNRG